MSATPGPARRPKRPAGPSASGGAPTRSAGPPTSGGARRRSPPPSPPRTPARAVPPVPEVASGGWCAHCERQVEAAEALVMKSGRLRCPDCRRRIEEGATAPARSAALAGATAGAVAAGSAEVGEEEELKAPWHFKVLAVGTVLYLVYRLIWFVFWLTGHAWHG